MEEATERLVKLYLESRGFLVKTGVKIKMENNRTLEVDILAIRSISKDDGLPNKILGEVKSWELKPEHIKEVSENLRISKNSKTRDSSAQLKLFNNKELREMFEEKLKNDYGEGFKWILFTRGIQKKYYGQINEYLKKNNILHIIHEEVIKGIINSTKQLRYSKDSELQLVILLKEFDFIKLM